MYCELSKEYRKIGRHLYRRSGNAYIHVHRLPAQFEYVSLATALQWYKSTIEPLRAG